jgi:hypothetical protein
MAEEMLSYMAVAVQGGAVHASRCNSLTEFEGSSRAYTRRPVKFVKFREVSAAKPRATVKSVNLPSGEIL